MKLRPVVLVTLSFALGVALAARTHRIWTVPLALSLGLGGVLLQYWLQLREAVRKAYSEPPVRWQWSDEPADLGPEGEELDAAWRELGYQLLGTLRGGEESGPGVASAVYVHPELPAYVRVWRQAGHSGKPQLASQMVSFFPDHGRLATTSYPGLGLFTAGVDSPAPRLTQYRYLGTPQALDGQHVGTLKAWMVGKRQPLPATPEALPGYLEADHAWLREALEQTGWLPLPLYLRSLTGKPKGTLTW